MWISLDYLGCAMDFTCRRIVGADAYSPKLAEGVFSEVAAPAL
jgi:hypothetical protein